MLNSSVRELDGTSDSSLIANVTLESFQRFCESEFDDPATVLNEIHE